MGRHARPSESGILREIEARHPAWTVRFLPGEGRYQAVGPGGQTVEAFAPMMLLLLISGAETGRGSAPTETVDEALTGELAAAIRAGVEMGVLPVLGDEPVPQTTPA
ncbi:hypothetical protein ACQEU5_25070 [Marinactinospora thermotolerans]|uniref:hypothetical protein n=1 Tax=Marinactinospora thermotolerans TaxID=531310 RepID=UPI003D93330F